MLFTPKSRLKITKLKPNRTLIDRTFLSFTSTSMTFDIEIS